MVISYQVYLFFSERFKTVETAYTSFGSSMPSSLSLSSPTDCLMTDPMYLCAITSYIYNRNGNMINHTYPRWFRPLCSRSPPGSSGIAAAATSLCHGNPPPQGFELQTLLESLFLLVQFHFRCHYCCCLEYQWEQVWQLWAPCLSSES